MNALNTNIYAYFFRRRNKFFHILQKILICF